MPLRSVLFAAIISLFLGATTLPLIDRDEPRFSRATVEMMEKNDWVIPWFNGEYRFDKPPLTYWLMRASYTVLGQTELGARFHSILSSIGVALVLLLWLRARGQQRAGFLAAIVWLTILQVQLHGRLAVADMPLLFFLTVTQLAVFELLYPSPGLKRIFPFLPVVLGLSLGFGFLAKGPLAYLVPLLTVTFFRFAFHRQPVPWKQLKPVTSLLVSIIPIAAWGIPALIVTQGAFWNVGMGEHVIDRGFDSFNSRSIIPGYYFLTIFLSFMPWWSWFGGTIWGNTIRWKSDPLHAFLASWAVSPFLIFLFYKTQLPHYTLPGFPALAALIAIVLATGKLDHRFARRWFWSTQIFWWILIMGLTVFFFYPNWPESWAPVRNMFGWLLLCLFLLTLAPLCWKSQKPILIRAMGYLILGSGLAFFQGSKLLRQVAIAPAVSHLKSQLGDEPSLMAYGFTEPSLVFYTDAYWQMLHRPEDTIRELESTNEGLAVVLEKETPLFEWLISEWSGNELKRVKNYQEKLREAKASGTSPLLTVPIAGFNTARISWSECQVWIKTPLVGSSPIPTDASSDVDKPADIRK